MPTKQLNREAPHYCPPDMPAMLTHLQVEPALKQHVGGLNPQLTGFKDHSLSYPECFSFTNIFLLFLNIFNGERG